ncbi:hypothetical protein BDV96DRAFT_660350 [Lophiotrema nucula]|uniref:Uncharacterized protein n=1 Tax=Lophiotrema nucula TaxID=690887 RepID=A0A6A5Z961_9PLEO|nr:hypothetical protein BDV96DRAFT_660350 [Lophiotrema nucula]
MVSNQIKIIGGAETFWLYSEADGYDLTHPPTPNAPKVYPRISLNTKKSRVVMDPKKNCSGDYRPPKLLSIPCSWPSLKWSYHQGGRPVVRLYYPSL